MFNYDGSSAINVVCDLTVGLFKHMDITSNLDLDISIKYMERIMRVPALKNFDRSSYSVRCWLGGWLDISGLSGRKRVRPWKSSGLGPRCMGAMRRDPPSVERKSDPDLIISYSLSW